MKRTTTNHRSRKSRKQSIPAHRRHPRGVFIGSQVITLRDAPAPDVGFLQHAAMMLAPMLSMFKRGGKRNG